MSRQELTNFLHAAEHSSKLRRDLRTCNNQEDLIAMANTYGFKINSQDILEDLDCERIEQWFKDSQITISFKPESQKT